MSELLSFDRVAGIYDATRGFPDGAGEAVADGLAGVLRSHGAASVLEVGVGTGRVAAPLADRGITVTGIDISRAMVNVLCAKGTTVRPVLAEATRLPFRGGTFESALFVHILHLVPDVHATLRETLRVMRPGGVLLSCVTSRDDDGAPPREAGRVLRETATALTGASIRPRGRHQDVQELFVAAMRDKGASLERVALAAWDEAETARSVLAEWLEQTHSNSWKAAPEQMPAVVAAAQPAVEALFGGMDVPYVARARFEVTVARLPA